MAASLNRSAQTWREFHRSSPRQLARHMAISALGGIAQLSGQVNFALRRPRVHILLLHHVFTDEEGRFRALLRRLSRKHAFISYSQAIARIHTNQIDRPYITWTFDDGFKNCMRAAEIMSEFGARGCFFICPSIIGERDPRKIEAFCRERLLLPGMPVEFMDWSDLEQLRDHGHDIGGHTMTHANLGRIPHAQAVEEIHASYEALGARLGEVRHFAWTFGQFEDCSTEAVRSIFEAGYRSCASGVRGCHIASGTTPHGPVCIRREHILAAAPMSHATYFIARSSRTRAISNHGWPPGWEAGAATAPVF